jgi:hypothetical protein
VEKLADLLNGQDLPELQSKISKADSCSVLLSKLKEGETVGHKAGE